MLYEVITDTLKSASDLGLPLVGVGLLYQKGYFRQILSLDGWQQDRITSYNVCYTKLLRANINFLKNLTLTAGGSGDFYDGGEDSNDQFNPKIGVTWSPIPDTTLRAAAFRVS